MRDVQIITPETHPKHHTVGKDFRAHDGHRYFCDSYDPRQGYWMTRIDAPEENKKDEHSQWRRNVSERAIGATFHEIWTLDGREYSQYGWEGKYQSKETEVASR